jgi:hypothetical protein
MENEAFTDMMENFCIVEIECKSGFFCSLLVYCFEVGDGEGLGVRISFWSGSWGWKLEWIPIDTYKKLEAL